MKGIMDSLWRARNITSLDGLCYEAINSSISQNIFSYVKMFSMQCRKNIAVGDNRKRMNIANLIYIYIYIYIVKDKGIYNKGIYIYIYMYLYYIWQELLKIKMIQ